MRVARALGLLALVFVTCGCLASGERRTRVVHEPLHCLAWSPLIRDRAGDALTVQVRLLNDCHHPIEVDPNGFEVRMTQDLGGTVRVRFHHRRANAIQLYRERPVNLDLLVDASTVPRGANLCVRIHSPDADPACRDLGFESEARPASADSGGVRISVEARVERVAEVEADLVDPFRDLRAADAAAPAASCLAFDLDAMPSEPPALRLAMKNECDQGLFINLRRTRLSVIGRAGARTARVGAGPDAVVFLAQGVEIIRTIQLDARVRPTEVCADLEEAVHPGPGPQPQCVHVPPRVPTLTRRYEPASDHGDEPTGSELRRR